MSVHSKLYYWVTCDHPECGARCPAGDYDIEAWADRGQAIDDALSSNWTVTLADEFGEQDVFFCEEHGPDDDEPLEVVAEATS